MNRPYGEEKEATIYARVTGGVAVVDHVDRSGRKTTGPLYVPKVGDDTAPI